MTDSLRPAALLVGWGLWVGLGLATLADYERSGVVPTAAPTRWPEGSGLPPPDGRPQLVLFVHPLCPCSPASIETFAQLARGRAKNAGLTLAVVAPAGLPPERAESVARTWQEAIPGLRAFLDRSGTEAARFRAPVSGTTLLYGADGSLRFEGGLTPARGLRGPSRGIELLGDLLADPGASGLGRCTAFGCELSEPDPARERSPTWRW